jgi:uncharacterized protein (DUF433 family)
MKAYNKIIKISSDKRFGRPCIRNTRITVFDILGWLGSGRSFEEVLNDYPELSREDKRDWLSGDKQLIRSQHQYFCIMTDLKYLDSFLPERMF